MKLQPYRFYFHMMQWKWWYNANAANITITPTARAVQSTSPITDGISGSIIFITYRPRCRRSSHRLLSDPIYEALELSIRELVAWANDRMLHNIARSWAEMEYPLVYRLHHPRLDEQHNEQYH
jgi:hypothetical protein